MLADASTPALLQVVLPPFSSPAKIKHFVIIFTCESKYITRGVTSNLIDKKERALIHEIGGGE